MEQTLQNLNTLSENNFLDWYSKENLEKILPKSYDLEYFHSIFDSVFKGENISSVKQSDIVNLFENTVFHVALQEEGIDVQDVFADFFAKLTTKSISDSIETVKEESDSILLGDIKIEQQDAPEILQILKNFLEEKGVTFPEGTEKISEDLFFIHGRKYILETGEDNRLFTKDIDYSISPVNKYDKKFQKIEFMNNQKLILFDGADFYLQNGKYLEKNGKKYQYFYGNIYEYVGENEYGELLSGNKIRMKMDGEIADVVYMDEGKGIFVKRDFSPVNGVYHKFLYFLQSNNGEKTALINRNSTNFSSNVFYVGEDVYNIKGEIIFTGKNIDYADFIDFRFFVSDDEVCIIPYGSEKYFLYDKKDFPNIFKPQKWRVIKFDTETGNIQLNLYEILGPTSSKILPKEERHTPVYTIVD